MKNFTLKSIVTISLLSSFIACSDSTSPSSSTDSSPTSSSQTATNSGSSATQTSSASTEGFGSITIKETSKYSVSLSILFNKGADLKISTDSTFTDESAGFSSGYYSASSTPVDYTFNSLKAGTKYFLRFEGSFSEQTPSGVTPFTTSPVEAPIISLKQYDNLDILIANKDDIGTLELSEDSTFTKVFSPDSFAIRKHLFNKTGEQRIQTYLGQTIWIRSKGSTELISNSLKLQAPPAMQWQSNALDTLAHRVTTAIDPSGTRTITLDSSDIFDKLVITIPNFKENVELAVTDNWTIEQKKDLVTLEKSTSKFMTLKNQVKDGWLDLYIPFYSIQEKKDEFDNSSPERYTSSDIRIRVKL